VVIAVGNAGADVTIPADLLAGLYFGSRNTMGIPGNGLQDSREKGVLQFQRCDTIPGNCAIGPEVPQILDQLVSSFHLQYPFAAYASADGGGPNPRPWPGTWDEGLNDAHRPRAPHLLPGGRGHVVLQHHVNQRFSLPHKGLEVEFFLCRLIVWPV